MPALMMDRPPRMVPIAMPALSAPDRDDELDEDEEEEEDEESDVAPVADAVLLLAEPVEEDEPELKSEAVTLKHGTWASKAAASTKVMSAQA